jgi:predicted phage tail component-like protein
MLSIDGVHIEKDLGLHLLADSSEPMLPDTREVKLTIPGKHGAYVFDSYFEPRTFFPRILIPSQADLTEVQQITRQISTMLLDAKGKPKDVTLIYDYEPDKHYIARFNGYIAIDRIAKTGIFPIPFTAYDPYSYHTISTEKITMDSDTSILSDVLLDSVYSFNVTAPQTLSVHNFSYYNIYPTIEIKGSFTSLTLSVNGKSFSFGSQTNKTINVSEFETKINGMNSLSAMTGESLEFIEGFNNVVVSGSNINVTITFKFKPKYL